MNFSISDTAICGFPLIYWTKLLTKMSYLCKVLTHSSAIKLKQRTTFKYSKAANGGVLEKKMSLKISQNSQESTCVEVSFLIKLQAWEFLKNHRKTPVSEFFNKVAGLMPVILFKKRLRHKCFPVKFTKILATPIL